MGSRKTDRLLTGVLSGAAFSVSSIIANLALLPIIFHQIGAAQYGMWLLLSAFAAYLYQADLGMGATMVHFAARHRGASVTEQREILSTGAAWMGLAGLVVLPLYVVVGHILVTLRGGGAHLTPEQGKVLLALGSLLVAGIGLRVFPSTLQGYGFLVIQRATQTIAVVVRVVATVVACFVLRSLIALAVGETIALLTPPVLCALELRRRGIPMPAWGSVRRTRFKEMIRYGIRAFCVGAMAIILLQGDAIIVGVVVNAAAVAYYGAAFRVYNSVLSAIGWMTDPLLAALTRLYGNDSARAREMFLGMLFATLWFACAVCGTLIIGAPGLIRVWLGPNVPTAEIATTLAVLLLGLMMSSTHEAAIPASGASGQPGVFAPLYAAWALSNLVLSSVLGSWLGIVGVALGTTLPLLVLEPLFVLRIESRLGIPWRRWFTSCLTPILGACGLAAVAALACVDALRGSLGPELASILGAVAYALAYVVMTLFRRQILPHKSLRAVLDARL